MGGHSLVLLVRAKIGLFVGPVLLDEFGELGTQVTYLIPQVRESIVGLAGVDGVGVPLLEFLCSIGWDVLLEGKRFPVRKSVIIGAEGDVGRRRREIDRSWSDIIPFHMIQSVY